MELTFIENKGWLGASDSSPRRENQMNNSGLIPKYAAARVEEEKECWMKQIASTTNFTCPVDRNNFAVVRAILA